jgi:hypothetical protein
VTTVVATAFELTASFQESNALYSIDTMINVAQVVFVTFSLFINCSTTFIMALKAWCVPIYGVFQKHFTDCLNYDTMCAYMQDIPKVVDGNRDWYSNP